MVTGKKIAKQFGLARMNLRGMRKKVGGLWKGILAGATGAALFLGNLGKSVHDTAVDFKDHTLNRNKKSGEAFEMKKSTFVALLVALAAVAGVLGALYFYVLRREKELDEYEQLLFSEDFNDDMLDDIGDEDEADEAAKAKA